MDGDEITGFAGRRQPRGVDVQSFIAATEQIQTLRSESTSFTEYSTGSFRDIETTFFDPASVFLSTH